MGYNYIPPPNVPRFRSVLDLVLRPVAVQRLPSLQVPEGRPHLVDVGDLGIVEDKPHLAACTAKRAGPEKEKHSRQVITDVKNSEKLATSLGFREERGHAS